jgi:hypothetical protein
MRCRCIVNQYVDSTKLRFREGNQVPNLFLFAHISPEEDRTATLTLDQVNGLIASSVVYVRDNHRSSAAGKPNGNGSPTPRTATSGDNHRPILWCHNISW